MPKFIIFIILVFISCSLKAQTWEIGGGIGGAGYMGDLNLNNPVKISGPSISGFFKRNFNGYLSARLNATLGTISAADSNSNSQQFRNRNLSFTTPLREISLMGEFNFMSYIPDAGKNKFTPYIYLGLGVVNYEPTTIYNGKKYYLKDLETEGEQKQYPKIAFSIPYGAGVKYNIWNKFTLGAEIGYRNPNTDYLDDVSGNYADKSKSSAIAKALADRSGEKTGIYIGTPGTQRGDLSPHDTYFFTQITISYTFVTQRCYFQ
jgi:opacity protein-like surface antigen